MRSSHSSIHIDGQFWIEWLELTMICITDMIYIGFGEICLYELKSLLTSSQKLVEEQP